MAECVVNPVTEESDAAAAAALHPHDAGLVCGADPGEDPGGADRRAQLGIVHLAQLCPGQAGALGQAQIPAHLRRNLEVVPGDDLDGDTEPRQAGEGLGRVGLRGVEEHQQADQAQIVLIRRLRRPRRRGIAQRDRDDPVPGGELHVQPRTDRGRHIEAAIQHSLRRALGDQREAPIRGSHHHRHPSALVIERQRADPLKGLGAGVLGGGCRCPP